MHHAIFGTNLKGKDIFFRSGILLSEIATQFLSVCLYLMYTANACERKTPCYNGGTCTNRVETPGYSCQCRPGYTGTQCETSEFFAYAEGGALYHRYMPKSM